MTTSWKKVTQQRIASIVDRVGLLNGLRSLRSGISKQYIRAINYHWTPTEHASQLDEQFHYFASHFQSINQEALNKFLDGGTQLKKPGILICFDDGSWNNYEVAAPLLEKYNLTGWFFIVAGACDPIKRIFNKKLNTRFCMEWAAVRDLSVRNHEIGCHTLTHAHLGPQAKCILRHEILLSKHILEDRLGIGLKSFCFPYGDSGCFSKNSLARVISHYDYVFHNFASTINSRGIVKSCVLEELRKSGVSC